MNQLDAQIINDLDDDLSDFLGDFGDREMKTTHTPNAPVMKPTSHTEACTACRNGRFISWGGRDLGICRKCKGTGKLTFKLSAEKRQAGRKYAQVAKVKKANDVAQQVADWAEANPIEYTWLTSNPSFNFAVSLLEFLNKRGNLTEGQLGAVRSIIVKNELRDAARTQEAAALKNSAPTVNVLPMIEAFASAQSKGIKRPKVRIDEYKFSLAPVTGSNAGAVYVTHKDGTYLGKIVEGKFLRVRDCSEITEGLIVAICANPKDAAIAYGKRYGVCSCCGRELTNHASIELGIGPICAEKYGW